MRSEEGHGVIRNMANCKNDWKLEFSEMSSDKKKKIEPISSVDCKLLSYFCVLYTQQAQTQGFTLYSTE